MDNKEIALELVKCLVAPIPMLPNKNVSIPEENIKNIVALYRAVLKELDSNPDIL